MFYGEFTNMLRGRIASHKRGSNGLMGDTLYVILSAVPHSPFREAGCIVAKARAVLHFDTLAQQRTLRELFLWLRPGSRAYHPAVAKDHE